ncbi:hypothetical protein C8J57DRAFT_1245568 [Mycena rebaudengoi]|nr:hypothetical protein C8J57DRAFT_1245568 [Mycena rebaudengoi]
MAFIKARLNIPFMLSLGAIVLLPKYQCFGDAQLSRISYQSFGHQCQATLVIYFLTHIIQVKSSAQEFARTAEYREQEELGRESDEFDWFYFLDRLIISHFCSKWRTVLLDNVEFWRHLHIHAGFPLTYLEKKRRVPFRKNVVPVPAHAPQNTKRYSRAILSTRESTSTGKSCTTAWTTSIRRGTQYPSGLPLREEAEVETRIPEAIDEVFIRRMATNRHERATVVDTERISDHSVGSFSTRSGSEFGNLRFWHRFSLLDTESDT